MVSMDFTQVDNPDDPQAGNKKPNPGHGMVVVKNFEEFGACKAKAHLLELEVVAWTDPDSLALIHAENIFHADTFNDGAPMQKMTALGIAGGLFTAADVVAAKENGQGMDPDFTLLVGRCLMVSLVQKPDKDDPRKIYTNVGDYGRGFYHVGDPRVKDWPRNERVYGERGSLSGNFMKAGEGSGAPAKEVKKDPFGSATNA